MGTSKRFVRIALWSVTLGMLIFGLGLENFFRQLIVQGGIYADETGTSGAIPPEQLIGWCGSILIIVTSAGAVVTLLIRGQGRIRLKSQGLSHMPKDGDQ